MTMVQRVVSTHTLESPRIALTHSIRSVFVSDLHLGSKFSRAEALLDFLEQHQPEYLYLVGDIVDGWCLSRKWHWPEIYNRLFDRLIELAKTGTKIRFTPGNHDEFLRRFLLNNEWICIQNEFVHCGADGRRFVILHGDRFDDIEIKARWLSIVGNIGYELILRVDHWTNRMLEASGCRRRRISQTIKVRIKQVVQFVGGFQDRVVHYARHHQCDAIVCGHIHMPECSHHGEILYVNLGDWVENSTALIEYRCGRLELFSADHDQPLARVAASLPDERVEFSDDCEPFAEVAPLQSAVA